VSRPVRGRAVELSFVVKLNQCWLDHLKMNWEAIIIYQRRNAIKIEIIYDGRELFFLCNIVVHYFSSFFNSTSLSYEFVLVEVTSFDEKSRQNHDCSAIKLLGLRVNLSLNLEVSEIGPCLNDAVYLSGFAI
jgi:hypothetical protein